MSTTYCAECNGDPRRRENVERHKQHEPLEPKPNALPDDSKEDWLDIP